MESCTDLAGHGLYLNLLGPLTEGKTRHKTPMGEELARGTLALDLAAGRPLGVSRALDRARKHVRHDPPWVNRPWVTSAEGRAGMLGFMLNCRLCDAPRES